MSRCIICGSRSIRDYELLKQVIRESGFEITEVVSGGAMGADTLGERWAEENGVTLTRMPADWNRYGKQAGLIRNVQMVEYVSPDGCMIALWDCSSRGTKQAIDKGRLAKLKVYVKRIPRE